MLFCPVLYVSVSVCVCMCRCVFVCREVVILF